MSLARRSAWHASTGQALAECLIGCLLLVPLWWFIRHWIDGQAHRATLQSQVRVAVLGESLASGGAAAVTAASGGDQFDVQVLRRHTPALAGDAERAALALIAPVEALAPARFAVRRDGWTRAEVSVAAPANPFWRQGPPRWRESLTLLIDDWSLPGPDSVERRTQTLLPTTPLEWAYAALDGVQSAVALLEPGLPSSCARRIDPEIVPEDRLVAAARAAAPLRSASGWRPRC